MFNVSSPFFHIETIIPDTQGKYYHQIVPSEYCLPRQIIQEFRQFFSPLIIQKYHSTLRQFMMEKFNSIISSILRSIAASEDGHASPAGLMRVDLTLSKRWMRMIRIVTIPRIFSSCHSPVKIAKELCKLSTSTMPGTN